MLSDCVLQVRSRTKLEAAKIPVFSVNEIDHEKSLYEVQSTRKLLPARELLLNGAGKVVCVGAENVTIEPDSRALHINPGMRTHAQCHILIRGRS